MCLRDFVAVYFWTSETVKFHTKGPPLFALSSSLSASFLLVVFVFFHTYLLHIWPLQLSPTVSLTFYFSSILYFPFSLFLSLFFYHQSMLSLSLFLCVLYFFSSCFPLFYSLSALWSTLLSFSTFTFTCSIWLFSECLLLSSLYLHSFLVKGHICRKLITESHFKLIKCWCFGLVADQPKASIFNTFGMRQNLTVKVW